MKTYGILSILLLCLFAALVPSAFAAGYGTSQVSLSQSSANISAGGNSSIGYIVQLTSGIKWGTTLSVLNSATLASEGISVSLSNPVGEPPFSGTMLVTLSQSVHPGSYSIVLQANGDDPSPGATFLVNVAQTKPVVNSTAQAASNSTVKSTVAQTTAVPTSTVPYSTVVAASTYNGNGYGTTAVIAIIIILLVCGYLAIRMNNMSAKIIWVGVALILLGVVVWLYGDYNGGLMQYIWSGVVAIIAGTMIWLLGDQKGGAFKTHK